MNGGSVIAIKYDGGVLMAADCLLAYGSLAKQPNVPRIRTLGRTSALCCTGDYADFGVMWQELDDLVQESRMDQSATPSVADEPSSKQLFNYMHRTVYQGRNNFEPLMCKFVMIGSETNAETNETTPFIGVCDSVGTRWTEDCAASGMAAYNCLPLMRRALELKKNLTRDEAMAVIHDCCRVIFYRECRAINRFQIADATAAKVTISDPFIVETNFEFSGFAFEKTAIIR